MLVSLLALLALALHVTGVLVAMHAVVNARTPQGAMAWALGLVLLPYLTLIPYLFLGASHFRGYVQALRPVPGNRPTAEPDVHPASVRYDAVAALLGRPFRGGHRLRLLIDGEAAFAAMLAAIAEARQYVLVQFFIIHDDAIGQRLQQALLERAAAGVRVCVLYDNVGSHDLPARYVEALRAGGVAIHAFATRRWSNRFQLNFRNHRKIVVVDGRDGFIGGLNVGDEYLGQRPPLAPWRDTHLALQGPVVQDLQHAFATDWRWITGIAPETAEPQPVDGPSSVLMVTAGPADAQETGSLFFTAAIHAARRRLWLSTPYFVPDSAVRAALELAVLRGVDVRVMIPSRPDHAGVFLASSLHAHDALRSGIRMFRYQPGFLHQKAMLIDDHSAAIGSMNLDTRSFRLNFEVTALAVDEGFAAEVETMLQADLDRCHEIDADEYSRAPYLRRVAMHVARLFDPIL